MFRVTTDSPSFLRAAFESISDIISEGTFKIDSEGVSLLAMDPAGVSMVVFKILPPAFKNYEAGETSITLNIDSLIKVLRRAKSSDRLEIFLDEEKNKLNIVLSGSSIRRFSLPLIEPVSSEQKMPPLNFSSKLEVDVSVLKDAVKDAAMVSDSVLFITDSDKFIIEAEGDSREFRMELNKDTPGLIFIEGSARAKYSIDYLAKMIKPTGFAEKLVMSLSNDYPLQIEFKSANKLQIMFVLAPRIEAD